MTKAYLEPDEVEQLEAAATCLRDKLLIRLLARLGCRVSEALALEAKDIDFAQGTVTIQHLKFRIKLSCPKCGANLGRSHAFCPKCGAKIEVPKSGEREHRRLRTLPIDNETLEILKDYIKRGGEVEKNGKLLIFGVNRHRAWQITKEAAKKAGLSNLVNPESGKMHNVSPHKLRDSFAVNALKTDGTGEGQRFLQEQLGHASFNTTAKYRKVAGEELRDWYSRLWKKAVKPKEPEPDGSQTK